MELRWQVLPAGNAKKEKWSFFFYVSSYDYFFQISQLRNRAVQSEIKLIIEYKHQT